MENAIKTSFREVTSFSLDEDVVRRLAWLADHLDMSRRAAESASCSSGSRGLVIHCWRVSRYCCFSDAPMRQPFAEVTHGKPDNPDI
jgi:hypothetical protein